MKDVKCLSCKKEVYRAKPAPKVEPARGAQVANALASHICPEPGALRRAWRAVAR